jgi:beta-N-acetylhexosaminidase
VRSRILVVLAVLLLSSALTTQEAQAMQATAATAATASTAGAAAVGAAAVAGTSTAPSTTTAEAVLAGMSLAQRVGQLFMMGSPVDRASGPTRRALRRYHVGSVILMGNSSAGRRTVATTVRGLQSTARPAAAGVGLLVAVDQEGGHVQRLTGPGFSDMPTALTQGRWRVHTLRTRARGWAVELRKAGVNLDLAPVADTVPVALSRSNQPIGRWQREFGHRPRRVARHAVAFLRGMRDAHVGTVAKHFPGLGRVRGNTDDTAVVVDRVTRRHDHYLMPFAATAGAGVPFMMMSLASYPRLDPASPAVFSRIVIQHVLRGDLGFEGVVVSDSMTAAAVARWSPAQRAVRFVAAGGDLVLVPEVAPVPEMYDAILARARRSPSFRDRVDEAALRVLRAKQPLGLL